MGSALVPQLRDPERAPAGPTREARRWTSCKDSHRVRTYLINRRELPDARAPNRLKPRERAGISQGGGETGARASERERFFFSSSPPPCEISLGFNVIGVLGRPTEESSRILREVDRRLRDVKARSRFMRWVLARHALSSLLPSQEPARFGAVVEQGEPCQRESTAEKAYTRGACSSWARDIHPPRSQWTPGVSRTATLHQGYARGPL
jgi:hypothetical protein